MAASDNSALVHNLFRAELLGGTVFFRPLMPEADTHEFRCDANALDDSAFDAEYGGPAGCMTQRTRYFDLIGRVPDRWRRAAFDDASIFHSGNIHTFSPEPCQAGMGRLTRYALFKSQKPNLRHHRDSQGIARFFGLAPSCNP